MFAVAGICMTGVGCYGIYTAQKMTNDLDIKRCDMRATLDVPKSNFTSMKNFDGGILQINKQTKLYVVDNMNRVTTVVKWENIRSSKILPLDVNHSTTSVMCDPKINSRSLSSSDVTELNKHCKQMYGITPDLPSSSCLYKINFYPISNADIIYKYCYSATSEQIISYSPESIINKRYEKESNDVDMIFLPSLLLCVSGIGTMLIK